MPMALDMRDIGGTEVICVSAPFFDEESGEVRDGILGIIKQDLAFRASHGQSAVVAQLYGLVADGISRTKHIFKGVKRPLLTDGNMDGDKAILVYARKPAFDCAWRGTQFDGLVERLDPPQGCVFVVYVTPNHRHKSQFDEIDGWINHWTWIDEDQALPEAPTDWVGRYLSRVWTRS